MPMSLKGNMPVSLNLDDKALDKMFRSARSTVGPIAAVL
jgi:hypothetical protein